MKNYACIFPGQGTQYVGMGKDFYENCPAAKAIFDEANDCLDRNFTELLFHGSERELTLTYNSQIAIYVMSFALYKALCSHQEIGLNSVAGLSLGEYTALSVSGRLSFSEGLALVKARGELMHQASIKHPGSMSVVLGVDSSSVMNHVQGIEGVWVANLNCPNQTVLSGTVNGLATAASRLKEHGISKILPLSVSGAFHSGLMEFAAGKLQEVVNRVTMQPSSVPIVMNATGSIEPENRLRELLVHQLTSSVYWEKSIHSMTELAPTAFLEIGPGKTLSGMNKKIGIAQPTISVNNWNHLVDLLEKGEFS